MKTLLTTLFLSVSLISWANTPEPSLKDLIKVVLEDKNEQTPTVKQMFAKIVEENSK